MNREKRLLIVGCVLGVSTQPFADWTQWQLPILVQYCPAKEPCADRFDRTEEMVRLEAVGFVPLGLVASNLDGHAGLGLVIVGETPATIRQYLLQQEPEIINKALEHENRRRAA